MSGSQFTSSSSCIFHGWLLLTPWHTFHPWVLGHHKLLVFSQHTNISFLDLLCWLCLFLLISKCCNAIGLSPRILSSLISALTSLVTHPVPRDCISSPAISSPRLTCLTAYWTSICECLINIENLMGQNWTFGLDIRISANGISCLAITQVKIIVSPFSFYHIPTTPGDSTFKAFRAWASLTPQLLSPWCESLYAPAWITVVVSLASLP